VGLNAEADGQIPGRIERAPQGPDGKDQGDFIDGNGQRWDVKSSPDLKPSYDPKAGEPIGKPQTTEAFEAMINKDLATGENVLIDPDGMTPARQDTLKAVIDSHPEWRGRVIWGR
jgi:hypothetical protein